jgi:hypothetical protein
MKKPVGHLNKMRVKFVPCLLFHTIRGYEMREKAGMLSAVDVRNLNTGSHGQLNRYRCRDMQLGLECGII